MKLHIDKIKKILDKNGHNQTWLAKQMKISRQLMSYKIKSRHINHAEKIAQILGVDPKDLML